MADNRAIDLDTRSQSLVQQIRSKSIGVINRFNGGQHDSDGIIHIIQPGLRANRPPLREQKENGNDPYPGSLWVGIAQLSPFTLAYFYYRIEFSRVTKLEHHRGSSIANLCNTARVSMHNDFALIPLN